MGSSASYSRIPYVALLIFISPVFLIVIRNPRVRILLSPTCSSPPLFSFPLYGSPVIHVALYLITFITRFQRRISLPTFHPCFHLCTSARPLLSGCIVSFAFRCFRSALQCLVPLSPRLCLQSSPLPIPLPSFARASPLPLLMSFRPFIVFDVGFIGCFSHVPPFSHHQSFPPPT